MATRQANKTTAKTRRAAKTPAKKAVKAEKITASESAQNNRSLGVTDRLRKIKLGKPERGPLAIGAAVAELLGTFVLALVAINSGANALFIAFAFIVLVLILAPLSGPHLNPAITIGLWAARKIGTYNALLYIAAQVLGGMLALAVATWIVSGQVDPTTNQPSAQAVYQYPEASDDSSVLQRGFVNELLGMMIFAFGVASANLVARGAFARAFVMGGALYFGLLVFTANPTPVLNPAVALSLNALNFTSLWSVLNFFVAPALGSLIAIQLYRMLLRDTQIKNSGKISEA